MKYTFGLIPCILLAATAAQAKPVSFPGGWMPMVEVSPHAVMGEVMFSPTARYAVGVRSEYDINEESYFGGVTYNRLLYRDNALASQTNLYLRTGLGNIHAQGDDALAGFIGLTADWEDRDYMVAYENRYIATGLARVEDKFEQRARIGITPYRAAYHEWQPWLMLQADHHPAEDEPLEVSPVLRVFNGGPVLAEAGISTRGRMFTSLTLSF